MVGIKTPPPPVAAAALRLAVAGEGLGDAMADDTLGLFLFPFADVITPWLDLRGEMGDVLADFRRLLTPPPESGALSFAPTLGLGFLLGDGLATIMSEFTLGLGLEFGDAIVSLILVDFRGALGEVSLLLPLLTACGSLTLRVVGPRGDTR